MANDKPAFSGEKIPSLGKRIVIGTALALVLLGTLTLVLYTMERYKEEVARYYEAKYW